MELLLLLITSIFMYPRERFMDCSVITPFAFVVEKTKGFVAAVIVSAVIVMVSAALCNQDFGALYPWTAAFFEKRKVGRHRLSTFIGN